MLRNADYVYNNILIADESITTKKFCKKAQVGVDLSVKNLYRITAPGIVYNSRTVVPSYALMTPSNIKDEDTGEEFGGWFLQGGTTLICELNEGCQLGENDTGMIIGRSSLNRSGVSLISALWDPGYTTRNGEKVNSMQVRIAIQNVNGFVLEKNSRVGQLLIFENESGELYKGQFQGGATR